MTAFRGNKTNPMRIRLYFSIRSALLLVVLLSLLPASYIVLVTGVEHGRHLEEQKKSEALRQAQSFAEIQLRITESTRQLLATLAALPDFRNGNYDRAEEILKSVHASNPDYLNLTLTDARGIVLASSLLSRGRELGGRPQIRNARSRKLFCAGEYVLGLVGEVPSFSYAYPVLDARGEPLEIVSAVYKLSSYAPLFETFRLDEDSFLGLFDIRGARLYSYPPREDHPIGGSIAENVWDKIRSGPDVGMFLDLGTDGTERFFGYRRLRLEGDTEPYLTVVFATPRAAVVSVSEAITKKNLTALTLAALASLALATIFSQILFGRRLSRIGAMVARLRGGYLDARVGLAGDGSDLGRIARALDDMAEVVQKRDKELVEEARRLNRLVEEKQVLLREVNHRVKNNLQSTLSLINLQKGRVKGDDASLTDLEARVSAIAMVHETLYGSENLAEIDLASCAVRLLDLLRELYDVGPQVVVGFDCEAVRSSLETAVSFGLLLNELATNAFKHALKDGGRLTVGLHARADAAILSVADSGPGLPDDFGLESGTGVGLSLVKALVEQLNGEISWENEGGARFLVTFSTADRGRGKTGHAAIQDGTPSP